MTYKLRSRVRHLTDEIPRMEKRLEDVRCDIAIRQDTSGDKFLMVIEGQEIRDRGIAGELLLRRAERMRGTSSDRLVGSIAGFQVFVADNFMQGPEIVLRGTTTYTAKATDSALGTIRSVEHTIQHLEDLAQTLAQNTTDVRKRLVDTQAQLYAPFEYVEKLGALVRRQLEIEDELDLAKNQALSGLGEGSDDSQEADSAQDSPSEIT